MILKIYRDWSSKSATGDNDRHLSQYEKPKHRCTKWILLEGKHYGNKNFRGAILVESKRLIPWSLLLLTGVSFHPPADDQAKQVLNTWLLNANNEDETVTILDSNLYSVTKHYVDNFIQMNLVQCYCPDCKTLHNQVLIKEYGASSKDKSQWNETWYCPERHIVYEEMQTVRLIF